MTITFRLADLRVNTRAILAAGAKAAEAAIRSHFRAMPSRSGFFAAQVAEGKVQTTSLTADAAEVEVDSRELAHYIAGGRVEPIPPRRALAIPLTDEARAAGYPSAGRIPNLFLLRTKLGQNNRRAGLLCTTDGTYLEAHYALVPFAEHDPHPDAWPAAAIEAEARTAMQISFDAQLAGR